MTSIPQVVIRNLGTVHRSWPRITTTSGAGVGAFALTGIDATLTKTSASGASGGNAALSWSASNGLVYRQPITFATDGTNPFGTGPQLHFYEDLNNVSLNADLTSGNSIFTDFDTTSPSARSDDTASGKSMRVWNGTTNATLGRAILNLGANVTELFVSHKMKIPAGTYFPGATAVQDFGGLSSWKEFWFFPFDRTNPNQASTNDLIFDNYGGQWKVFDSNSLTDTYQDGWTPDINPATSGNFGWGGRNRFSTWVKADTVNPATAPTKAWKQIMHTVGAGYRAEKSWNPLPAATYDATSEPVFSPGSGGNYDAAHLYWRYMNVPGFMGNFSGSNYDPRHSEICINAGSNAAARVELGNASTYAACTKLEILHHTAWSTGSITGVLTSGDISLSGTVYAYITLSDNSTRYSVQVH